MEDWKNLSLSQLKRLAKSRAGRIAELQMEVRIIEGIMDSKIRSGDFRAAPREERPQQKPESKENKPETKKEESMSREPHVQHPQQPQSSQSQQPSQEPLIRPPTQTPQPAQQQIIQPQHGLNQTPGQKTHPDFEKKENGKPKPSNPHAFKEID